MAENDPAESPSIIDAGTITELLVSAKDGDAAAAERLFTSLQAEMRHTAAQMMRSEPAGHTLQPTAVVNEAMVRLLKVDIVRQAVNRRYLFAAANRAMSRTLVDYARRRRADRRPDARQRTALDYVLDSLQQRSKVEVEELAEALENLRKHSPRQAEVTELRFFSGLNNDEIAEVLEVGVATVKRDWSLAKAKLFQVLRFEP